MWPLRLRVRARFRAIPAIPSIRKALSNENPTILGFAGKRWPAGRRRRLPPAAGWPGRPPRCHALSSPKGPPTSIVASHGKTSMRARGEGGCMAPRREPPPKELYALFPSWHKMIYFFASQHKFFFGPPERIFSRNFAGMLRKIGSPSCPNFIIFGHPQNIL